MGDELVCKKHLDTKLFQLQLWNCRPKTPDRQSCDHLALVRERYMSKDFSTLDPAQWQQWGVPCEIPNSIHPSAHLEAPQCHIHSSKIALLLWILLSGSNGKSHVSSRSENPRTVCSHSVKVRDHWTKLHLEKLERLKCLNFFMTPACRREKVPRLRGQFCRDFWQPTSWKISTISDH